MVQGLADGIVSPAQNILRLMIPTQNAKWNLGAILGLEPVKARSDGDATKPGAELLRLGQCPQRAKASHQRFLSHVFGSAGTAHARMAEGGDASGPPAHQLFVSLGLPGKGLTDQLTIRH